MFWMGLLVGCGLGVTLNMLVLGVMAMAIIRQDNNKPEGGWGD